MNGVPDFVPIALVSKVDLDRRLREGSRGFTEAGRHLSLRRVLIAGQVGLAVVLLVSGGLVGKSLWRLLTQAVGMDRANLLNVSIAARPGQRSRAEELAFYDEIMTRLESRFPGGHICLATACLVPAGFTWNNSLNIRWIRRRREIIIYNEVAPDYFQTLGVPILRGRSFDENKPDEIVINERMASVFWPAADPIGQRLVAGNTTPSEADNPWLTVVKRHSMILKCRSRVLTTVKPGFFSPLRSPGLAAVTLFRMQRHDPHRQGPRAIRST